MVAEENVENKKTGKNRKNSIFEGSGGAGKKTAHFRGGLASRWAMSQKKSLLNIRQGRRKKKKKKKDRWGGGGGGGEGGPFSQFQLPSGKDSLKRIK